MSTRPSTRGGAKRAKSRPSPVKRCEINYAIWFCSAHQCYLDDNGKCKRVVAKVKRKS